MSVGELAAFVCTHLKDNGIEVVLSGGACVFPFTPRTDTSHMIWTSLKTDRPGRKKIQGSASENRILPLRSIDTSRIRKRSFSSEFPPGPLSIGDEPVKAKPLKENSPQACSGSSHRRIASRTGSPPIITGMTGEASIRRSSWLWNVK